MPTERFLAQPDSLRHAVPLARVRSTLVVSALVTLRERNLYAGYLTKLPESRHEEMQSLVAGVWMATDVATDHYAACEALGLSLQEMVAMGAAVGHRFQASVLSTLTRLATGAGVTPWVGLAIYDRLWARMFDGGGFVIDKVGPKDAILTVAQLPFLRFRYFRVAFRGVHMAGLAPFAKRVYVREIPSPFGAHTLALHMSWV